MKGWNTKRSIWSINTGSWRRSGLEKIMSLIHYDRVRRCVQSYKSHWCCDAVFWSIFRAGGGLSGRSPPWQTARQRAGGELPCVTSHRYSHSFPPGAGPSSAESGSLTSPRGPIVGRPRTGVVARSQVARGPGRYDPARGPIMYSGWALQNGDSGKEDLFDHWECETKWKGWFLHQRFDEPVRLLEFLIHIYKPNPR